MRSCEVRIAGTDTKFVQDEQEVCLLRAALRAGVGFPYECNSGGCGTCKYELVQGEIETLWAEAPGLNERDRKRGRRLACQSRAKTDCVIRLRPSPEYVLKLTPRRFEARLISADRVTHDMREFRFQAPDAAQFLPGQYAMMLLPGVRGARAYSMSNVPNGPGEWCFYIRRVPGGKATSRLFDDVRVGETVLIDAPFGYAFLKPESPRAIVCIAGGSGISPMLSIARGAVLDPRLAGRPIFFFYGGRTPRDICGEAELKALPGFGERIRYFPAISMPGHESEWQGRRGLIHEIVEQELGNALSQYEFYLAGPPPMAEAVREMLAMKNRVPIGQIHYDRFF
jgi:toluene monooxygenase electron transfer component